MAEEMEPIKPRFEVYNSKTGEVKGNYGSKERARTSRDKHDNAYGSYVHKIREKKPL